MYAVSTSPFDQFPLADTTTPVAMFWFRRDIRLHDNTALYHALSSTAAVLPLFIFDTDILDHLPDRADRRVEFIHRALADVQQVLGTAGSGLFTAVGKPVDVFRELLAQVRVQAVFANEDYEPYARRRDSEVAALLREHGVALHLYKDQVIHAKDEILSGQGTPFQVFTAYKNRWLAATGELPAVPSEQLLARFLKVRTALPSLASIGFSATGTAFPPVRVDADLLRHYARDRDIPALNATTQLGVHLRFGTVSIREVVRLARLHSDTWLGELIWREFFMMVLYHRPDVVASCYRTEYNAIVWRNNEEEFRRWCEGRTGFPLVDAGMRQLNATGFMHNRVRMAAAGFVVKDLLVDWRWGEAYFARTLLDYELASNNGNWQWVAGTGCDAAPYFRVFNPETQRKKFDPRDEYCRRWIPELGTPDYPPPMVDHAAARQRALQVYAAAVRSKAGDVSDTKR